MSEKDNLDSILEQSAPCLRSDERVALWQRVKAELRPVAPVRSPYWAFFPSYSMTPLALVLVLLLGTGTTVAASDVAKPGDLLFPLERAIERTQLALVSDDRAKELRSSFATERLVELEAIIAEEARPVTEEVAAPTVLVSEAGEVRISRAVNELLDLVEEVDEDTVRTEYVEKLLTRIDTVAVEGKERSKQRGNERSVEVRIPDSRVQIKDDRVEVRDDGYRVRFADDKVHDTVNKRSANSDGEDDDDTDDFGTALEEEFDMDEAPSEREDDVYEDDGDRRGHDNDRGRKSDRDDEDDEKDDDRDDDKEDD